MLSAPGRAGSPPKHHGASVGPDRGPWHVLWEFKVASSNGEAFRARRAIQVHANRRTGLKTKCPTAHTISMILNFVNAARHFLVMKNHFPRYQTCETCDQFKYKKIQSPWPPKEGLFPRTTLCGRCGHSMACPSPATHSCTS